MIKPLVFQHYAANGRTITACGLRIAPNSDKNERQHSNGRSTWTHAGGEPTCRKCRAVLKSTKIVDIVRCSEDGSPLALDHAVAAHEKAVVLVMHLGKRWEPRIWHNLGWHHEAVSGQLRVSGSGHRFHAYFDPGSHWGKGTTPLAAVRATLQLIEAARDVLDEKLCTARRSIR